jgi:hypothetical protein
MALLHGTLQFVSSVYQAGRRAFKVIRFCEVPFVCADANMSEGPVPERAKTDHRRAGFDQPAVSGSG